jgi:DNA-binding SARP family transcriptional activator
LHRLGVRIGGGGAGLLATLPTDHPATVAVKALGGFRVVREGSAVAPSDWRSKKARDVLKILVAHRGHPVTRDYLIEAIWPDEDPALTGNRLSVALSTIRGVLDPEKNWSADRFLVTREQSISIDTDHVAVDVEAFLSQAAEGLREQRAGHNPEALELLEDAETAYTGDFLEEDVYEDWSMGLREEARAAYRAVAGALAELAAQAGKHDDAIRYRLRIVERDPYDEDSQLGLVRAFIGAGRHGEARRAYRSYAGRMEQIGVEPAPLPAADA